MKILQICPPWIGIPPQNYGGTEWVIYNLTEELIKMGHQVTLFATGNTTTSAQLKYVYDTGLFEQNDQGWSLMQPALALPALVHYDQAFKEAETGHYDMVHAHLSAGTDIMKLKFLADCQVPVVATTHMVFPFDKWSYNDDQFIKYYAKDVKIICISQAQSQLYPAQFHKLGVVHNGLDMSLLQFQPHPQGWEGQPYLTWLGKIMPWKGLDIAIQVALKTGHSLLFAGVLDEHNHPESAVYFKQHIEPFIDGQQIRYLGPADLALKNKLLGNALAFLNPITWDEPFGMVSTEAMATGTPVISFARGGANETVASGYSGFLVEDEQQMIQAVQSIAAIDRQQCRRHVEQNFSAQTMANRYVSLYQQVRQLTHASFSPHYTKPATSFAKIEADSP